MSTFQLQLSDELKAVAISRAPATGVSVDQYVADLIAADYSVPIS